YLLTTHHFNIWEGGGGIYDVYVDACLLRGIESFANKRYQEALNDFEAALEYPENLEVGRPRNGRMSSRILYFIGTAHEGLGNKERARESYDKSVSMDGGDSQILYYRGLAYKKIGRQTKAAEIFDRLIAVGKKRLEERASSDFFAKFGEKEDQAAQMATAHYLIGLGYAGKGDQDDAKAEFDKALQLNANHLWAAAQLKALK
ncbi:MAG: tetratricopeptide repeat protein, partial [Candidatus Brocadiales bacterium]|nr:tetratricopeptide repeat protein [Candidatus Bathyanammoxibius sp.]